jgi:hypothetical protein
MVLSWKIGKVVHLKRSKDSCGLPSCAVRMKREHSHGLSHDWASHQRGAVVEPTIGRIVLYRLTKEDAAQVNRRRTNGQSIKERMAISVLGKMGVLQDEIRAWPQGAQAHIGWPVKDGQVFPMMITNVDPVTIEGYVSGQVFLNGNDVLWKVDAPEGKENGQWSWPERK